MPKINPFKPHSPVSPGMFVGRVLELERLETNLLQTRAGNPSNFMITGERGIGKSSLLNYVKALAQGKVTTLDSEVLRFLVVDTDIDQNTTQVGLAKKIELGLREGLGQDEPARRLFKEFWDVFKRVEAAGVKLRPEERAEQEETILEEFSYSLAETVKRVVTHESNQSVFNTHYDGILILIDEADSSGRALQLGSFFKLLTERLQRRGCEHLMVGLAGLPDLREVLASSHPSSLRLFDEQPLGRLSEVEVAQVIEAGLKKAENDNRVKCGITKDAMVSLVKLSEGYPHFIQQFGYSAFAVDVDNMIDSEDVLEGAFGRRGALAAIGSRYYRDDFYNKIQQESYRQVLCIMADRLDGWVTKDEIRAAFNGSVTTLDSAIKALRERHIIVSKEGERGVYKLQHKGFALWIKLETTNAVPKDFSELISG
jgi:AAA ATPase domain